MKKLYMELRGCTGGDEALAFANDLLSVYLKYARKNDIKADLVSANKTTIILFQGKDLVIEPLLSEGGVHRVQRVSKGKLHTSTVSVAVLPVTTTSKVSINPNDLRIDNYRGSGAGGQHRNTTDSAVRITHIPTGIVVCCENERSQYQNKAFALEILQSKLEQNLLAKENQKMNSNRHKQVGSGDRAEARRTYNYVRSEVTDDITNTRCSLKDFMDKANILAIK